MDKEPNMSIYFLRQLKAKDKTWIRDNAVKVYHAPQFEGLDKEDMLDWGFQYQQVKDALPDTKLELEKLHRDYISSVIYTIMGNPFVTWCQGRINQRNQELLQKQDQIIWMDPEVATAIRNSNSVSTTKGNGANLLKVSLPLRIFGH